MYLQKTIANKNDKKHNKWLKPNLNYSFKGND